MNDANMGDLLAAGFKHVATWQRSDTGEVRCEGAIPTSCGIYLFAVAGAVRYVGAAKSLRKRIRSYERRQNKSEPGRRAIHGELAKVLKSDSGVETFVLELSPSVEITWHGLPIEPTLGIEAGLIKKLNPLWNRRGRTLLLDSDAVPP